MDPSAFPSLCASTSTARHRALGAAPGGAAPGVLSAGPLPARTPQASGGRVGSLRPAKSDKLLLGFRVSGVWFTEPVFASTRNQRPETRDRSLNEGVCKKS